MGSSTAGFSARAPLRPSNSRAGTRIIRYVSRYVVWPAILGALLFASSGMAAESLTGTWACQSMSVGAYTGRRCPTEPWLKLNADKSYTWGRETGKWAQGAAGLSLSGRAGKGNLNDAGKLIFEYDLNGKHYTLTLYRRPE